MYHSHSRRKIEIIVYFSDVFLIIHDSLCLFPIITFMQFTINLNLLVIDFVEGRCRQILGVGYIRRIRPSLTRRITRY